MSAERDVFIASSDPKWRREADAVPGTCESCGVQVMYHADQRPDGCRLVCEGCAPLSGVDYETGIVRHVQGCEHPACPCRALLMEHGSVEALGAHVRRYFARKARQ